MLSLSLFSLQFLCFANSLHSLSFFPFRFQHQQQQQTPLLSAAHFSVVFAGTAFASAAAAVAWHFIFALPRFDVTQTLKLRLRLLLLLCHRKSVSQSVRLILAPESDSHQFLHARMCVCVCVCLNWKKCSSFFVLFLSLGNWLPTPASTTGATVGWLVGWLATTDTAAEKRCVCVKEESELLLPFAVMVDGSCKHKLLLLLLPLLKRRPTFGLYECVCLCLYFAAFLLVFFIFICFSLH